MRFRLSFTFALGVQLDQYYLLERYPFSPFIVFYLQTRKSRKEGWKGKGDRKGGEEREEREEEVTFVKYGFTCELNITYLPVLKLTLFFLITLAMCKLSILILKISNLKY